VAHVLEYANRRVNQSDPLFGRDLGFLLFVAAVLAGRSLYTWSHRAGGGTLIMVGGGYVLQRSLVLTGRAGPRLARRGPRPTCSAWPRC